MWTEVTDKVTRDQPEVTMEIQRSKSHRRRATGAEFCCRRQGSTYYKFTNRTHIRCWCMQRAPTWSLRLQKLALAIDRLGLCTCQCHWLWVGPHTVIVIIYDTRQQGTSLADNAFFSAFSCVLGHCCLSHIHLSVCVCVCVCVCVLSLIHIWRCRRWP